MLFIHTPRSLKDKGLRRVKSGKIGPSFPRRRSTRLPSLCRRVREGHATFQGTGQFPASQINALGADFMHQRCAFLVGTGAVGHRVNELAGFVENGGAEVGQPV